MAPATFDHVVIPPPMFSSPTGAMPPKKTQNRYSMPKTSDHGSNGVPNRRHRLLTVDEALQYSPLSSIVPFSLDIIPTPNAHLTSSQKPFITSFEEQAARQPLKLLDKAIIETHGGSNLAQIALKTIHPYLDQKVITKFNFKEHAGLSGSLTGARSSSKSNGHTPHSTQLGPFANMVLNATDLNPRYPTPTSATSAPPKSQTLSETRLKGRTEEISRLSKQQPNSITPITPQSHIQNENAFAQNSQLSLNDGTLRLHEPAKLCPIVLIKPLPAESKPSDYVKLLDERSGIDSSRKRKRDLGRGSFGITAETKDQRAISDETVHRFQEFTQDLFEADDQLQSDASSNITTDAAQYFISAHYEDRESHTISPAMHIRLESLLQKVISAGRYADIPSESLCRIQSLCEGALSLAESSDFNGSDDDLKWVQGVEAFDLGLRSTRTILRIMAGGREEKKIYSEELLQNILRVIGKVLNSCIIPIVQARNTGLSYIFETASAHRKPVSQLLHDVNKVMGLLAELLGKVDMVESIITTMESLATQLLFVENAHIEKESVFGISKVESLRRTAMDIIAEIFSRYSEQRTYLFDEILTSLQKLPVNRPHARQYKLPEGKSIQLVSALIMRLVQTSATTGVVKKNHRRRTPVVDRDEQGDYDDSEDDRVDPGTTDQDGASPGEISESEAGTRSSAIMQRLANNANSLSDDAARNAQYVIRFYVQRAMTSPKTGDQPHRHLLDMFAEDLIMVLGLPEWPAAELLLRALLVRMIDIAENKKYNTPAKSMALELLGLMGSAISELVSTTRHKAANLENQDSAFSGYLRQLLDDYMDAKLEIAELLGWEGPYHAVLEYLEQSGLGDKQTASAQGYILTQWAKAVASGNSNAGAGSEKLAKRLRRMLSRAQWVSLESEIEAVSNNQSRLSYGLTVLNMDFCRQFDRVLKILLDSISSEHITVRTRSLKSVTQMLEQDPSLLDRARNVKVLIMKCATDISSMVRDSALMLIGKCILLKPALEQEFCKTVLTLSTDSAIGVRKRAIRLLKDIYLRNSRKDIRSAIADNLLQRVKDLDVGVSDLVRQTFEDLWFSPYWKSEESADLSVQDKISLQHQVGLLVGTVQRGEMVASVMISLLQDILSGKSKMAAANFKVCKILITIAFEGMIDTVDVSERRHILQTLTIFARANARLFAPEQLQYLQPYITNLDKSDDLNIFRSVVIIFRCVLPIVSTVQHSLLRDVQTALLHSIARAGRAELDEVAACLWTINGTLNDPEKLIKLTVSVLKNLRSLENIDFADSEHAKDLNRVKKYIRIAGYFGKHCDFENHKKTFQQNLPWWKGSSVAGLFVSSISPFAGTKQPFPLRADALDGIGLICQSWPYQFNQENISCMFQEILENGRPELQKIVLSSFRDFFSKQERQAEVKNHDRANTENPQANKLGSSMTASDGDGASALIAQRFLKSVLRIALASQDISALTATQVITSINRQGLVHPKESGPALVALETSTNQDIADLAFQEHRNLHQQHESMFEREYMRAIQEAFKYQKEIVKDPLGTTSQPPVSKLRAMFEIIKTSKGKYQKKFLSNFCSKIDFDVMKSDTTDVMLNRLQFSRFLIENLAFFEYGRIDELLHTISCMEKIVASTGSGIAHSISTEVFHINVESSIKNPSAGAQDVKETSEISNHNVDPKRLSQLASVAVILSSLWEARTFLRRLFGLPTNHQRRDSKSKALAKDVNKAPVKVQGVFGERLLATIAEKMTSLDTPESMLEECKDFIELLSVDNEVKVAADGEEDTTQADTPSGDDEQDPPTPASGGPRSTKRKASVSVSGTPQKKRKGRPSAGPRRKSGKSVNNEDKWC